MLKKCLSYDNNNKNYEITVHLIRQIAHPNTINNDNIDIHHNDNDFIMTTVLNNENINGGMKYIYDNNNELHHTIILKEGEGIIHNNKYFYYDFSPIESLDQEQKGYRDIVSFNFKETDLTLKF